MSLEQVERTAVGSDGYYEHLQVEGVFRFIFVAMSVGMLAGGIAIFAVFLDADALLSPFVLIWLLGIIYLIFMAFTYRELEIRLDKEKLDLKLGLFHSFLPVSGITETHIGRCRSESTIKGWIHPGIQVGRGFRSWSVPFRGGVSIHMRIDGKKKLVYVSSKAPDKFKAALERLRELDEKAPVD